MQAFLDRLIAQGVFGSLPTTLVYTGMMFFFGVLVVFVFFLPIAGITSWLERRVWSRAQSRVGPNRVGPQGALQWLADGIKLLLKEDLCPDAADRPLFFFAPYFIMWGVIAPFAVLPFLGFYQFRLPLCPVSP